MRHGIEKTGGTRKMVGLGRETDRPALARRLMTTALVRPLALMAVCLGCASGQPSGASPSLTPGDHEISIRHDGRTRLAIVHVPPGNSGAPRPLVMAFHGGGGDASGFKAYAGLDALADREDFIAVYPYGTGVLPRRLLTWNAGANCCGYALDNNVDDVGFTLALIDEVSRRLAVDPERIYATGHSNGSMMAFRLAAEHAQVFAAIAPIAGMMDIPDFGPAAAVPVLYIHSVDDPRALYDGGLGPPFPMTEHRVTHVPVADGLALWAANNGCAAEPATRAERTGVPGTINAGQSAALLAYGPCSSGMPVEHWRLTGVGHGWPGWTGGGPGEGLSGPPTTIVNAAEEAWNFFQRFRR